MSKQYPSFPRASKQGGRPSSQPQASTEEIYIIESSESPVSVDDNSGKHPQNQKNNADDQEVYNWYRAQNVISDDEEKGTFSSKTKRLAEKASRRSTSSAKVDEVLSVESGEISEVESQAVVAPSKPPSEPRAATTSESVADENHLEQSHESIRENDDFISFDLLGDDAFKAASGDNVEAADNKSLPVEADSVGTTSRSDRYRAGSRSVRDVDILSPLPIPPWVDDPSRYSENLVDMLNEEVTDFVDFMVPNEAEHSLRVLTVQRIRDLAIRLWGPQTTVNVFGSFETKLYLPSSDVDIAIFGCGERTPSCLYTLQGELRKSKFASKVEVIASAKVPILKYVDALTGFPVDVSFDIAGGVQSVSIVKQFMEDPSCAVALKPLVMIIKQFLMQRYLNEVYTGGMGSYAVLSLVAAFLKVHPLLQSGQIDAKRNLGILLIEFLELYGRNFNFSNMGLAVTLDGVYYFNKDEFRQQRRFGGEKFMFTVLDPQDPSNDITRGSYNAGVIRREFGKAYTRITGIIGAFVHRERQHQEWQRSRRRSMNETVFEQPRRPNTILGTILTIPKQVLIHRQEIQERWERVRGDQNIRLEIPLSWSLETENRSRKKGGKSKAETDYVYVIDDSDEEPPGTKSKSPAWSPKSNRKRQRVQKKLPPKPIELSDSDMQISNDSGDENTRRSNYNREVQQLTSKVLQEEYGHGSLHDPADVPRPSDTRDADLSRYEALDMLLSPRPGGKRKKK